jgi:hypothetical protein
VTIGNWTRSSSTSRVAMTALQLSVGVLACQQQAYSDVPSSGGHDDGRPGRL